MTAQVRSNPKSVRCRDRSPAEIVREVLDRIDADEALPRRREWVLYDGPDDTDEVAARMPIPRYERIDVDGWLPRRASRQRERRFERSASA